MKQQTAAQALFWGRALLATGLGVLGYVINTWPLPLFSNIQLVLGNALILVCASRLGWGYTLYCAAIALTGLMQTFGTPYVYVIYGLEALFVCVLRRRGWFLIYADFLYWCLLGMPITWVVIQHAFYIPGDYQLFTVVKQSFNGLLYTALASLLLLLIPKSWFAALQQQPRLFHNIHKKLVHAVLVLISLALMVSVVLASNHLMQVQQSLLTEHLHERSDHLVSQYHDYLADHQKALTIASQWLASHREPEQRHQQLLRLQQMYPNFVEFWLSNAQGQVTQWRAESDLILQEQTHSTALPDVAHSVQRVLAGASPSFDKQVYPDRESATVMISVLIPSVSGEAVEILSARLVLNGGAVGNGQKMWGDFVSVLTDHEGQVIQASADLPLQRFSAFEFSHKEERGYGAIPLMNLSRADSFVGEFFYTQATLDNGWQLYVLLPYRSVAERQERHFLIGIALLLLGMCAVVFFTRKVSAYITAPLEFLVRSLAKSQKSDDPLEPLPPQPFEPTKEISALYQELGNNRNALKVYQLQLEDLVQTRTAELEAANARLAQLAHRDGLTGAYNRRYFDQQFEVNRQHCARSGGYLALAMIDIDHFKSINDNYGHLVGDDCLKSLVALIQQQFSRKLDLLARFGGEEFVLLLPQSDADEVLKRLETLRHKVEQTALSEDSQGNLLFVTVSIGVLVAKPKYSETMNYWLMAADDALYHAKEQGRNRLCQAQVAASEEPSWTVLEVEPSLAQS